MPEIAHEKFPAADFDPWAETYDQDVATYSDFPFAGYEQVLESVVARADVHPGMDVLDLGTGTGNLAVRFSDMGCNLWCADFSEPMLAKARLKLPQAQLVLHDLHCPWPAELTLRFDRIVSGYVFHHFEAEKKVSLCRELVSQRLVPGGRLVIADLSFPSQSMLDEFRKKMVDWEEEFYWLADESVQALGDAGLNVSYEQVSPCAGIYLLEKGTS
jgi:cyclopropane fatty-acyl-phospholipid synthase-like methyltransferase